MFGAAGLISQGWPVWHIIVPFDQNRAGTGAGQNVSKQVPDRRGDRAGVAVDQQGGTVIVGVMVMPADMDFRHAGQWEGVEISLGRKAEVHRRDENIVHIKQQAAAGATREFGKEFRFGPRAFGKGEVT